jgi:hypothetical protein
LPQGKSGGVSDDEFHIFLIFGALVVLLLVIVLRSLD